MIKKLNKNRIRRERSLTSFYFDKDTSDYTRIWIQLWDIKFELKELREEIWIYVLRLRFAIANTKSFEIKTQLKFQEKIILEHIEQIEKLKKENSEAISKNYEKEYGYDMSFFF
tara:strand:+ start:811 stop:1152 length:342 start_codon:yes stop_codon:yes gene_type:complete